MPLDNYCFKYVKYVQYFKGNKYITVYVAETSLMGTKTQNETTHHRA